MLIASEGIKISFLCTSHYLSLSNHSYILLLTSQILSQSLQRYEMDKCLSRSYSVSQKSLKKKNEF